MNCNSELIGQLAGIRDFKASTDMTKPTNAAVVITGDGTEIHVHDVIDPEAERARLGKQKQQLEKALNGVQAKLGNENFVSRAKPEVVEQAREKLKELAAQLESIESHLSKL